MHCGICKSICIIHKPEDLMESIYIKEFYKFIGFSYFAIPFDDNTNWDRVINERDADSLFDIYLVIGNGTMNEVKKTFPDSQLLRSVSTRKKKKIARCMDLLKSSIRIWDNEYKDVNADILHDLEDVYNDNKLCEGLYGYAFVTIPDIIRAKKMDFKESGIQFVEKAFSDANDCIEQVEKKYKFESYEQKGPYLIYAKNVCKYKINFICDLKKRVSRHKENDLINELNTIYHIDDDFCKTGYLQAKIAELGFETEPLSIGYYQKSIKKSKLNVCKSVFMYEYGKWLDKNGESASAKITYRNSLRMDRNNIKPLFKIAINAKSYNENFNAREYFQKIVDIWDMCKNRECIPLLELEYIGKSLYQLSELTDEFEKKEKLDEKKKELMIFIDEIKQGKVVGYYTNVLYQCDTLKKEILDIMKKRIEMACTGNYMEVHSVGQA